MPDLDQFGLTEKLSEKFEQQETDFVNLARIIKEHRESYVIQNAQGEFNAEITGNLRYAAASRSDFPAVGDWVEATVFEGDLAIIHKVLPRFSLLERQSVGAYGEIQIIAANIDVAFIVQAVDRDFNLNRLERYFVIAHDGGIKPVVILNKTDLITEDQLDIIKEQVLERLHDATIFQTSTIANKGLAELEEYLEKGKTYCFIGSSGVGKSTIINFLMGANVLETNEVSESTNKGKHTTSHRELILMDNGSIIIDTPGMREIGITDSYTGLEMTFDEIVELASGCKFNDCTHTDEPGCQVLEAIECGKLSFVEYKNYKKLERQSEHFSATIVEKRKKDKAFGKMYKEVIKSKKKNKW